VCACACSSCRLHSSSSRRASACSDAARARASASVCSQPDVQLAAYPDGHYLYLLTGLEPLGGYPFVWPWVADTELASILQELERPKARVVVSLEDVVVWGRYDTREYLAPIIGYVRSNYARTDAGLFLSPALAKDCASHGP